MSSKYVDTSSIIQVIGCVYNNPNLLEDTDKYIISEDDFPEDFHKIVFGTIYKLYSLGANKVSLENINDFLESRPKKKAIYEMNRGDEYLKKVSEMAKEETFDYYYHRVKKMSLLRAYDNIGLDVSFIYDPDNILDSKKKQIQEDFLDNSSIVQLTELIDKRIDSIKENFISNLYGKSAQAGQGLRALVRSLKETPEVGVPLYGPLINTITRGARLKKFYLRSAPTGVGKSRTMIADCCNIGCNMIYDENFGWIKNGKAEPCLYITTEQELAEIQTMMLAFLSNVNEEHILNGKYEEGEEDRIQTAVEILENSPIYVEELPDFSLQDVENLIKKGIREHDTKFVFFDYIHTSMKILEEITRRSGGVKLREDNILFMLSIKLKDLCNQYGIFIMSSTQLNGDYQEAKTPDQNLLRGAKAIADKIDCGMVLLPVKDTDISALENVLATNLFEMPTLKISIYKNRRGRYKGVMLWCKGDLGTCRIKPMFMTNYNYELMSIDDIKIMVKEEESAF